MLRCELGGDGARSACDKDVHACRKEDEGESRQGDAAGRQLDDAAALEASREGSSAKASCVGAPDGVELPPLWERVAPDGGRADGRVGEGAGAFWDVITNRTQEAAPECVRGGIVADDMGLGTAAHTLRTRCARAV